MLSSFKQNRIKEVRIMDKLDYIVKRAEETAKNRDEMSTEHTDHTNYSDDYCAGFLGG